jgi:hypothetical protein
MRSTKTFKEELKAIGDIPGVLYESERDYIDNAAKRSPFFVLQELERQFRLDAYRSIDKIEYRRLPNIPDTQYVFENSLEKVYKSSKRSDEDLAETLFEETGMDIEGALNAYAVDVVGGQFSRLGALTADLGTEAFGCYLPWHAFVRSSSTPWGLYIFLEPLLLWTAQVYVNSQQLPKPKPKLLTLLNLLFNVTFRHELFHYHIERFAIRQEVIQRKPIYRPYVSEVRAKVAGTHDWLEEALAQAVVLESTLLRNRSGFSKEVIKKILILEFNKFPPGYRDFDCPTYSGPEIAHEYLGTQVARVELEPQHLVTELATPLKEYSADSAGVPGYLVWHPAVASRFQLTPPRTQQFKRFASRSGMERVGSGPGDHEVYRHGSRKFHINEKRGVIDLASIKALAKIMKTPVYSLIKQIREA